MRRLVTATIAVAALAVLAPVGASAQTQDDIEVRDQLIAAQENLLNDYRCKFGVGADAVPGGCPEPDRVEPGPAPGSPTQNDIAVRDDLIDAQEALLNEYRCRFSVDVEQVPGGCLDGSPVPVHERDPYPGDYSGVVGESLPVDGWVFEMICGIADKGTHTHSGYEWTTWYADITTRIVARDERPWDRLRSFFIEHSVSVDGSVVARQPKPGWTLWVDTPDMWTPHGDDSWRLVGGTWSGRVFQKRTGGGFPDQWFRYELRGGYAPRKVPIRYNPFEADHSVTCTADPIYIQDSEGRVLLGENPIG